MNVTTSVHLDDSTRPQVHLYASGTSPTFAGVHLDGKVQLLAFEPAQLVLIAEACTDAARQLSQQFDLEAARAVNAAAEQAERRARYDEPTAAAS